MMKTAERALLFLVLSLVACGVLAPLLMWVWLS